MIEVFRFFRLGIINLIGITLPGLLILLFTLAGILAPLVTLVIHVNNGMFNTHEPGTWGTIYSFYQKNTGIVLSLLIVLAYVIGYIVRLSTPDDLDIISAHKVLKSMEKEESQADSWPFRGEAGDKFPYFYFREYLESRSLPHLAKLVTWGPPDLADRSEPTASGDDACARGKRTKTQINLMKLEISHHSPELAAVVESNEAHVRLLFGTWYAVVTCRWMVVAGFILSLGGYGANLLPEFFHTTEPYLFCILSGMILLMGMSWARRRIENLFHYQRVRELTHILGAYHLVKLATQASQPAASLKAA